MVKRAKDSGDKACCRNCVDTNVCTDDFCRDDGSCEHVKVTDPARGCCNGAAYSPGDQCCEAGEIISKPVLDFDVLEAKCLHRKQNSRLYEVDGCSLPEDAGILSPGQDVNDPTGGHCGLGPMPVT